MIGFLFAVAVGCAFLIDTIREIHAETRYQEKLINTMNEKLGYLNEN